MPRPPLNTYRLQLTSEFGFRAALDVIGYLDDLGVTDLYLSPILQATPGSEHGYDVCDPTRLDERLGSRAEFDALSDELQSRGMGLVLDIVPNHMAAHLANPWWYDVLKHGRSSRYAGFFDINWDAGQGRLLLPVLGGPVDDALAAGELTLENGAVVYHDQRFPLAPDTEVPSGACDAALVRRVLEQQHYELAFWREQAQRMNYRRFFDISGLVAMRVERPEVFDAMHALVLELVAEGRVTGLRVDHVDGLYDPRAYLERLQQRAQEASGSDAPFWIVVEKILASPWEQLPDGWPVAGTTGYDFLDAVDGLLVSGEGAAELERFYDEVCGERQSFHHVAIVEKRRVMRTLFGSELRMLASWLADLLHERALHEDELAEAIVEVTTHLPVYRTYADERTGLSSADLALIEGAVAASPPSRAVRALHEVLLSELAFTMRWQQFTGPVTAKAVEDTAFYRYNALPERNEVGAHPDEPALPAERFEMLMRRRSERQPHTMNAGSTHDTKRSEDVRARLAVLTHLVDEWTELVRTLEQRYRPPDPHDGYLVYVTLAAAPDIDGERLAGYLVKAAREAKRHTSWIDQNQAYEQALIAFAEQIRADERVRAFASRIERPGRQLALLALAHRIAARGVCDVYQGCEVEQLSLVDPDNRRPVDFARARELLATLDAGEEVGDADAADAEKLGLTALGLRWRRARRDDWEAGACEPPEPIRRLIARLPSELVREHALCQ